MLRRYTILIDGESVGSIARNSTIDLEVSSGAVTVEARVDWGRSKPLSVEVLPDERIDILVSNHWGALLGLWAITFGAGSYLKLERLSVSDDGSQGS